jgi:hypothetical protein
MIVAIAAEGPDPEVYRHPLGMVLDTSVIRYKPGRLFGGCKGVLKHFPTHLADTANEGVRHALLAIDNDGGRNGPPEHDSGHVVPDEIATTPACRTCLVLNRLPQAWRDAQRFHCVVVPVQILETWLLCARGHRFTTRSPERFYDRDQLKELLYGKAPFPAQAERVRMALDELNGPGMLGVLRERRSFHRMEIQFRGWRT